jgi:hypothetical protein
VLSSAAIASSGLSAEVEAPGEFMTHEEPDQQAIAPILHVGDRVERLDLTGEARWGTIVGPDDTGDWLVRDNLGNTQSNEELNLRRAVRLVGPSERR